MGDRGNIIVIDADEPLAGIVLYSHWGGTDLPSVLRDVLERGRQRWDDSQYLTRMIFCAMVRGDESGETGYGISTFIGDNEHDYLVVDVERKVVVKVKKTPVGGEDATARAIMERARKSKGTPFEAYVAKAVGR